MSKVRFDLDLPGLNELMKGAEIQAFLQTKGEMVASRARAMCPDGEYSVRTKPIRFIAACNVSVENEIALQDSYENNTLVKALHGGG